MNCWRKKKGQELNSLFCMGRTSEKGEKRIIETTKLGERAIGVKEFQASQVNSPGRPLAKPLDGRNPQGHGSLSPGTLDSPYEKRVGEIGYRRVGLGRRQQHISDSGKSWVGVKE